MFVAEHGSYVIHLFLPGTSNATSYTVKSFSISDSGILLFTDTNGVRRFTSAPFLVEPLVNR